MPSVTQAFGTQLIRIEHMLTAESKEEKICRMNVSEQEGALSVLNFHYLVGTSKGVQYFTERHELGLFAIEDMIGAFKKSGLEAEFDENGISGRGMFIAKVVA